MFGGTAMSKGRDSTVTMELRISDKTLTFWLDGDRFTDFDVDTTNKYHMVVSVFNMVGVEKDANRAPFDKHCVELMQFKSAISSE